MTTLPLMATLTRLLRRLLLAATLLLLAGLLPAATLLLTRTRVALLRLARLRLVRVTHALSPQGLTGPTPLASTHGTAESCGAKRAMRVRNRAISTPISAKISPRTQIGSHSLVSTIVVDERGTAGPEAHRFDRAEEYVVAAHRSDLDDTAIERDHGRGEYGAAGRESQPISAGKSLAACNPGAAREYVGDLRAAISQRVDAKYAILHHDRIGLAAAIEAHEQHGRRVRNRTNRGCRRAGLAAGTGCGDHVNGRAEAAHPFAKERGLDRAHRIGPHRREGAVHRIIGPLVDPAHCAYSAARLTPASPG